MKLITRQTWLVVLLVFIFEALSLAAYYYPPLKIIGGLILVIFTLVATWRNLEFGLLILFAELIIGSKGHLLELSFISGRMIIFGIVMLVYLVQLFKKEERAKLIAAWLEFKSKKALIALAFFVITSLIIALANTTKLTDIFADFNNWLFFLIIFPITAVYFQAKPEIYKRLAIVATAAFLWLSLETFLILYLYSHNISVMTDIYFWLRKTGVAEVTATLNGFPRIFLQSQIYAAVVILITTFSLKIKDKGIWLLATLAWGVIFLSMSRSFWLALIVCLLLGLVSNFKQLVKNLSFVLFTAVMGAVLIFLIVIFPIPRAGSFSLDSFTNRLSSGEAAVASRWSLLPVLVNEIKQSPIIGKGFGHSVNYKSSDPRVLADNPSGEYTTYAFEWGYLALWLKLGILGLISYLWLLGQNILIGFKQRNFLFLSLILVGLIQIFTPYLDHPLGIALVVMIIVLTESCLKLENNVY
jgi:O-antigen ligase